MVQEQISFFDHKSHYISGILTLPEQSTHKAVILCHGFLSHKNSRTNVALAELLRARDIASFRFDWIGSGDSQEPFSTISIRGCCELLESTAEYLRQKAFSSLGLIGSSYGGFIITLVSHTIPNIRAMGLKCPVVDFAKLLRRELGELGMKEWAAMDRIPNVVTGSGSIHLPYRFYEECSSTDALSAAKNIQVPTMIVHGEHDEFVPLSDVQKLHEALQGPKMLHILPGADHHFKREADFHRMTLLLVGWMESHG